MARTATKKTTSRKSVDAADRLTKQDWVDAALSALAEGGVSEVRVEVLAKNLRVTKGIFYWHFKDREALLKEMLRAWRLKLTSAIGRLVQEKSKDPKARLKFLLDLSTESDRPDVPGGRFEQAIRQWALTSEMARDALRQVDAERLEILAALYRDAGLKRAEAAAYAFLFYSYAIGANTISSELGLQATKTMHELCAQALTTPNDDLKR